MADTAPSHRFRWLWPIALATTIFLVSGRSNIAAPHIIGFDKLAHFSVFGLLGTLVCRADSPRHRAWLTILLVSVYGGLDEWHQSFTPGRSVDFLDWIADTVGAALAAFMYRGWGVYRTWLESPVGRRRDESLANASSSS